MFPDYYKETGYKIIGENKKIICFNMSIALCRICLENTAHLPIFDCEKNETNIHYKLSMCLKEKIEDQEGYPRYICETCNDILDKFCNFINKYKDTTSKLLQKRLEIVKEENDQVSFSDQLDIDEDPIVDIKKEPDFINDVVSTQHEHLKPIEKRLKIKKVKQKSIEPTKRSLDINNKIATSILEGEFSWNGSQWCLSSKETKIKPKQVPKIQKAIKIPIPKQKTPKLPKLCDLCGEVFKSHERLTVHKKRTHWSKHSQCKHCLKMFGCSYDLKRHIKRKHEKERNFVCAICGKGFSFRGELTNHQKNVHEKHLKPEKQFKCKFCNKSYKCSKSVVVHERSAHTGYRPAVCTVCGTSFFHEEYLKEHMRLHTGETPFKCPICGRGYAQRGNMKSHLRIHKRSELDEEALNKIQPNYLKLLKA